jgi:uncharacterized protein (DUF362 family)/Pyruvate/2-oxoacid:ferredoxin oxidoreductase delta subunit
MNPVVSIVACKEYDLEAVRQAVKACLEPLGGLPRFVRRGMNVLLKPNLLVAAEEEQAVTTHPLVVRAVAELVQAAGGRVLIGDSPSGPISGNAEVMHKSGMLAVAEACAAKLVPFEGVTWKQNQGADYFIARPVLEADLLINLPKIKTHSQTLYTGAVKNLFGVIPGERKMEVHIRAPGSQDFSRELVNLLELVPPALTIQDGINGQEGNGPGAGGTPHAYGCLAASTDPVALDTIISQAMGFEPGEVLHLSLAGTRRLGVSDPDKIRVVARAGVLDFGLLTLPASHWYMRIPAWLSAPIKGTIKLQPVVNAVTCTGCGKCAKSCPGQAITVAKPSRVNLKKCVGCMCCAEVCPEGAVTPHRGRMARLLGMET